MSKISSKSPSRPSAASTASACRREPFVKIERRPGNPPISSRSPGVRAEKVPHGNVVDEVQVVVRLGAVLLHQADEGDAVLVVVAPAQLVGGGPADAQVRREELVDAGVHRAEQAVLGRVEGVVEVEEPLRVGAHRL